MSSSSLWFFRQMGNFCYFSNFEFRGTLLTQIMPNFCRPHTFQLTKYSNFLEDNSFLTAVLQCGLRNCSFFHSIHLLSIFSFFFSFSFLFGLLYPFSIFKFFSYFFNLLLFFTFITFSILFQFYYSHILDLFQFFFDKPKLILYPQVLKRHNPTNIIIQHLPPTWLHIDL